MLSSNSERKWDIFSWETIRRLKRYNRCLKIYNRLLWGSTSERIFLVASKGRLRIKRKGDFRWATNKHLETGQLDLVMSRKSQAWRRESNLFVY